MNSTINQSIAHQRSILRTGVFANESVESEINRNGKMKFDIDFKGFNSQNTQHNDSWSRCNPCVEAKFNSLYNVGLC